jgi:hypothetical protein
MRTPFLRSSRLRRSTSKTPNRMNEAHEALSEVAMTSPATYGRK